MSELSRIAVLGGTFDPFHRGHLDPLISLFEVMGWSEILYVPAYQQPFKQGQHSTSPFHRYAMLVLGTAHEPRARVTVDELERGGVSYTVETLERLSSVMPGTTIDWVIGDDNLDLLSQWKSIGRIFELANFVVLRRTGAAFPEELTHRLAHASTRPRAGTIMLLDNPEIRISATEIRSRLAAGQSIAGLVEPQVENYIVRHGLYASRTQQEEPIHA